MNGITLKIDFVKTIEILEKLKANTSYEEMECLGLDYNKEFLVATIKIKKPYGYSGNLCIKEVKNMLLSGPIGITNANGHFWA